MRAQRAKCEGSKPPNESRGARASLCGGRASPRTFVPFRGNARTYHWPVIATFFFSREMIFARCHSVKRLGNEADRRVLAGRGASRLRKSETVVGHGLTERRPRIHFRREKQRPPPPRAPGAGDMSFSRGRRPTLEWERPKSAVPTTTTLPRSVPSAVPASAPPDRHPSRARSARRASSANGRARPRRGLRPGALPTCPTTLGRIPPHRGADVPLVRDGPLARGHGRVPEASITLRNRAGPGVEGLERCLAAFAAYDPRRRGVIKRADFARALKNTLDVTLTERQSVAVAEDCRADAPPHPPASRGSTTATFCARASLPSRGRWGSCPRRTAPRRGFSAESRRGSRNWTAAQTPVWTLRGTTRSSGRRRRRRSTTRRENHQLDPRAFSGAADGRFTAPSRACATWASRTRATYPTRVGDAYRFGKHHSDVTSRTLQGRAHARRPGGDRARAAAQPVPRRRQSGGNARPLVDRNAPAHEGAMEALRTKLRERHAGMARSTGFGARALRATLTVTFQSREKPARRALRLCAVPARRGLRERQRAQGAPPRALRVLLRRERKAVRGRVLPPGGARGLHGGVLRASMPPARDDETNRNAFSDSDSDSSRDSSPGAKRFGSTARTSPRWRRTATPYRSMPPERAREKNAPLNVFAHDARARDDDDARRRGGRRALVPPGPPGSPLGKARPFWRRGGDSFHFLPGVGRNLRHAFPETQAGTARSARRTGTGRSPCGGGARESARPRTLDRAEFLARPSR